MKVIRDGCANEKTNTFKCVIKLICHVVLLLHHVYTSVYLLHLNYLVNCNANYNKLTREAFKYSAHYLSHWNFFFQFIFLALAVTHDIQEWNRTMYSRSAFTVKFARDVIFASLVIPNTVIAFSVFWALYIYDRELVYPKHLDVVLPMWAVHSVHTVILVVIVLEVLLEPRRKPMHRRFEISLITYLEVMFFAQVGLIYWLKEYLLYPFFKKFGLIHFAIFITSLYVIKLLSYFGYYKVCEYMPKDNDTRYGIEIIENCETLNTLKKNQ